MPLVTTTLVTMPKPRGAAARRPDKKPFQLTAWNQIALTLTGFFDGRSLSTASGFVQPLVNATPLPQTDAAIEVWTPGKAVRPFEDLERALVEAENQSTVLVKADMPRCGIAAVWHEYFTFVFTAQALIMGLATVVWLLIRGAAQSER